MLDLRYGQRLAAPSRPPPRDAEQARLQELGVLAALPHVDRSFSPEGARAFEREVEGLRARSAALTGAGFFMGVARAVALSANAHTNVDLRSWREKLSSAPVRFAWFPEGLFVVRSCSNPRTR